MLQTIKNMVYDLVVWSGVIHWIIPLVKPLAKYLFGAGRNPSCPKITDDAGATINISVINGKHYPPFAEEKIKAVPNVKIRENDVLLCGYPKTGCHWTHEILHMLVTKEAKLTKHGKELGGMIDLMPSIIIDSLPSPRVLNSHLLYDELPKQIREKKTKIVITMRNPKDTVVSFFNHHKNLDFLYEYNGDFDNYFKLFLKGTLDYGSYFDYVLDWDKVIKTQNDGPNPILLISFEDIKTRSMETVIKVAKFLDIEITDQFASEILEACDFQKMKEARKDIPKLFRKGKVGDWKNWLTDEQSAAIDKMWAKRMTGCLYQPTYN